MQYHVEGWRGAAGTRLEQSRSQRWVGNTEYVALTNEMTNRRYHHAGTDMSANFGNKVSPTFLGDLTIGY
jgi:hypothetical protein